ncbi:hypothetical protein HDA32_004727 [Spinactinospora alkalitolerans]|uniref:DUF2637 domain-containing protein n=1 Tax=Spinactinospora alkalitolerans TaxID=687207 RepID=A0A852U1Y8_9ACTN|nr:hypothetical protein [Spinactinospora alkalitolerans]NYE49607.1 hypothetical protein [Spinactinospora alkalitolerans]
MTTTTTAAKNDVDELEQLRQRLSRREDRAQVRAQVRAERTKRRAQQRQEAIRRGAMLAGESARTRHRIARSGEARAMRVERTRALALGCLLPVIAAFGGWSAAGVQAGMVNLLSLDPGSPAAAAAWLVEPALLGIVAGVILIRARLQSAGGDLDARATRIEFGALATSIVLNAAGHWPEAFDAGALAALAGHALGPIGAAGTAYLISIIQDGVASATPWVLDDGSEAPSLVDQADPESAPQDVPESAPGSTGAPLPPALDWVTVPAEARHLPIVARTAPQPRPERPQQQSSTADRRKEQDSEAPRKTRPNKGAKIPAAAKKRAAEDSPRALSDAELADRLSALIATDELSADAPVRRIQSALGVGFDRAKRVLAIHQDRTETVVASGLSVVTDSAA